MRYIRHRQVRDLLAVLATGMLAAGALTVVLSLDACNAPPAEPGEEHDPSTERPKSVDDAGDNSMVMVPTPDVDSSAPAPTKVTPINLIDNGMVATGRTVNIVGAVVVGLPYSDGHLSAAPMSCIYRAFVQDPMGMAPCGIQLVSAGPPCTPGANNDCTCPAPADSKTPLAEITAIGDMLTLIGRVDNVGVVSDAGSYAEHLLGVSNVTKTGSGTVTPVVITDPTPFAKNGMGYQMYESMLVTLQPSGGIQVTAPSATYKTFSGGGAFFEGTYADAFENDGAFPAAKSSWTSITGVANPVSGGGVAPRLATDFVQ